MDISTVDGDFFDGDWFEWEDRSKSMHNGRSFAVLPASIDYLDRIVAMNLKREPDEATLKGSYSEKEGLKLEGELKWKNAPGPASKERECSQKKEEARDQDNSSAKEPSQSPTKYSGRV